MQLKPFDENSTCPKCNARDVSMRYCTDEHGTGEGASAAATEHLHRQCARCGYEWLEATLDAAEGGVQQTPS